MKVNYHTHTYRCKHADGDEKDYVLSAIEKGISILGFSDHAPFKCDSYHLRMNFCELEDYINKIRKLQQQYKNTINIKCGLEIEYFPNQNSYYKELLEDFKLDYLVLGQHFYINNNQMINTYLLDNSSQYIDYANSVIQAMKTGYFKFLAHPDVVFVNDIKWDKNCEKFCDLIVNESKENDFILEFNANGYRRGSKKYCDGERYGYPYKKFWEKVAKKNIRVVINSDCHSPELIWDSYMKKAYKEAEDLGLNIIKEIF